MESVIVREIATAVIDLPLRRRHTFSTASTDNQSYVLVRVTSDSGVEGIGEGAVPGGPWWGAATIEAIQAAIDLHLAPILIGADATRGEHLHQLLVRAAPAEYAARSALEMAMLDLVGKSFDMPVYQMLGGLCHTSIPVAWALSASEQDASASEIDERLDAGHRRFKLKAGAADPEADVARAVRLVEQLAGRADVLVDPNGAWDALTARRCCRRLHDAGVAMVEQPLAGWDMEGLRRLSDETGIAIMADESVHTPHDALRAVTSGCASAWSLKTQKSGGPYDLRRVAAVGDAAGIRLYGGTMLESSVGTAAILHVLASLPRLHEGCELIGPQLLAEEVVCDPITYRDGRVTVPTGPGLGLVLDEDRVARYTRPNAAYQFTA